jgi:signal peptidase II
LLPPDSEPVEPGGPAPILAIPEAPALPARRSSRLVWWLGLTVIVADQITKALLRASVPLYDSKPIIPGFLNFVHVRNDGMAFGLLNTVDFEYKWLVTTGLALVALGGIAYYTWHLRPEERLARTGLTLILGGALGNLLDRLYAGYVVDFVDVYFGDWHFWAFNVADAAINIGAVLVFVELFFMRRHASHPV